MSINICFFRSAAATSAECCAFVSVTHALPSQLSWAVTGATDTEAQHSAAVGAAEAQRQSLIDTAMASISLIQLKLQAGRKLTQAETTRLNAVLDYIDAVTATDTSTAPDVIWPELPEA